MVRHRGPQCSKIFSETAWPIKAKFYVEPPWVRGTKFCSQHVGHMTKMVATPIYGKNPSNFFAGTGGLISTHLVCIMKISPCKTLHLPCLILVQPWKTSPDDWKIVDWDIKPLFYPLLQLFPMKWLCNSFPHSSAQENKFDLAVKKCHSQPRVIIDINFVELQSLMLHAKF